MANQTRKTTQIRSTSNKNALNTTRRANSNSGNTYTQKRKQAARRALAEDNVQEDNSRRNEIYLFIYLAVAIFLLCSNFGWCGVVGDFISKIIFGLMGSVAYLVPVYAFFSAAFLLSNGAHKKIIKRVLCVGIFLVVIAFICQLLAGTGGQGIASLYKAGANNKQGGGVLLGGVLVLLHKLIGTTGSIIVIVLLTIIGIIIVMDVSIVDMFKEKFSMDDEDEDYYEDEDYDDVHRPRDRDVLGSIRVLESNDKKDKKKKVKNRVVESEEIHELKPVKQDDFFSKSNLSKDLAFSSVENQFKDDFNENPENVEDLTPVKRRRKKTKDSYAQMVESREEVAKDIISTSANVASSISVDTEDSSSTAIKSKNSDLTISSSKQTGTYKFPPIDLLKTSKSKSTGTSEASVKETAMKLKSTLENFGVNVTITDVSCGPSVTRYELQPEQGVKVSKIVNLADDIKLNLAAADIRIEAPIPGKAAIGIEVPNKESSSVYFRDLLESQTFKKFPSNIAFAVGKDIGGQVIVADIAKMPHLLVAGATGSGKSVCINTLIMSILYKANPNDVKMIMVDPKQVELSIYNGIPHMLIPVVTDPKKAAGALNWAVMEMTNRYQMFAQYNVRNLQGYNEKVKEVTGTEEGNEELKKLPQIIIIVDELADLMMVAHGEVEDAIVRLSQLARAAGIHLVIATQRPSVDVITGLIKANVPSRIAMTVSSGVDSRTILDMNGAEKLLGKGDMLFYPTGYPKPVRVQGAFLSDDEIADVCDFLRTQNGESSYDEKITQEIASTSVGSGTSVAGGVGSDLDEYFVDAGKFIIEKDKASIGMLQRVYKIGFNRAARIMDQLSDAGVVGPEEGTKPRKVIMSMEEFENYVENM
ncbi:MAG: DNA translocase FtsK [Lachnospiraceae bacterium]|nr:DNA translocase FtsK [Lachnospiraceae bacterium]